MFAPTQSLSLETMLPDLLRQHPETRPVFDRYGLSGCGGLTGPHETLGFFARTHGVPEPQLLDELHAAIAAPESLPLAPAAPQVADTIYRRFFTAGIALVLTAGATWGASLLWQIGFKGAFTGISIHAVNAHGNAQIFGWVGLFIMGFAYQAFPRLWHTKLAAPHLAVAAFAMMTIGLVIGTVGMTAAGAGWALPAAMLGGALETTAAFIFIAQLLATFLRSGKPLEPYVAFAVAALVWFGLMSIASLWHTYHTMAARSDRELLWYVATYQAPLRDLQIHGLALFMILGVSIRMLPALFGVPATSDRRAWTALSLLTAAVLGEVTLFVAYRWTDSHVLAAGLLLPWTLLLAGCALVALPWRLWRTPVEMKQAPDRSFKFVRGAYAWLLASLIMLLLLPVYLSVTGLPFSHAYYGAIRHAITVGFISLMIMGFAAKVVPTLNGVNPARLTQLWGPFLLVNIGCFLRVSTQTLTDFWHGAFAIVGISGTLEVAGLAWWGLGLVAIMRQGKRQERAALAGENAGTLLSALPILDAPASDHPAKIVAQHKVADVLDWFPATEPVFERHGFSAIRQPLLRRTVARHVTLAQAASMHGVPLERFVADLNAAAGATIAEDCSTCPSASAGCGQEH